MTNEEIINADFPMGENTNSNIGLGVMDWQHVGGGKPFPTPPLGPVARMVSGAKLGQGRMGAEIGNYPVDAKTTGGVVGMAHLGSASLPAISQAQDVTNSSTNINQTDNGINLSAKYKNPQKKSIVDGKGANQYM